MGYRGAVRSINASINRSIRESERKERMRQKQLKAIAKENLIQTNNDIVNKFNNLVSRITKIIPKSIIDYINWYDLDDTMPKFDKKYEEEYLLSKERLENYKPNIIMYIFLIGFIIRYVYSKDFISKKEIYKYKFEKYSTEYKNWNDTYATFRDIVLNRKTVKYNLVWSYFKDNLELFLDDDGAEINFNGNVSNIVINVIDIDKIIPFESMSILKSGKISSKKITKSNRNLMYADHVSSTVLKILQSLYNLFHVKHMKVTVKCNMLSKKTGQIENCDILKLIAFDSNIEYINIFAVEPFIALENFTHTVNFKKTTGFKCINSLPVKKNKKNIAPEIDDNFLDDFKGALNMLKSNLRNNNLSLKMIYNINEDFESLYGVYKYLLNEYSNKYNDDNIDIVKASMANKISEIDNINKVFLDNKIKSENNDIEYIKDMVEAFYEL